MGVVLSFEESQAERASIAPLVNVTAAGMERVNRLDEARTARERQRLHRMLRDAQPPE